jgi:ornithine carbamoyltransferase
MPDRLARMERDLLSIDDVTSSELARLLELAAKV